SLWLAEFLMKHLKRCYFVAIWRDVEPTVASMLQHPGVLKWYEKLPDNRINRFLGITKTNLEYFSQLNVEEKAALRWLSHKREIERLESLYPEQFLSVKFDDFITNYQNCSERIAHLLSIDNRFAPENFKYGSLDKWRTQLSAEQIGRIYRVLERQN